MTTRKRVEVYQDNILVGTIPRLKKPPGTYIKFNLSPDPDPRTTEMEVKWKTTHDGWWKYAVLVADQKLTMKDLRSIQGFIPRWPRLFGIKFM